MLKFNYHAPTEIIFGQDKPKKIGEFINNYKGTHVLIVSGKKFSNDSGLLDIIKQSLTNNNISYEVLNGVIENPLASKVNEGVAIVKEKRLNFILAVGGGSVIDTAKAIAAGVYIKDDIWSLINKRDIKRALPVGVILTIPGAGSEMSEIAVISNDKTKLKRSFAGVALLPKFAILDPTLSYSLSNYQSACGIVDIIMHTLERFLTNNDTLEITDNIASALIQNMFKQAYIVLDDPTNFKARAEIMWSASLSHNGLTGAKGGNGDWSTHLLSHEISSKYNVAHGQALASLWSSWAKYVYKHNIERFKLFATKIMEINAENKSDDLLILEAINKLDSFFKDIGLKTNLKSLDIEIDEMIINELSLKASHNNTLTIGSIKALNVSDIKNIYAIANT